MDSETVAAVLTFLLVTGSFMSLFAYGEARYRQHLIRKRLFGGRKAQTQVEKAEKPLSEMVWHRLVVGLGVAAAPKKEKELTDIRRHLSYAGYRGPEAHLVYFGAKAGLALALGTGYLLVALAAGGLDLRRLIFTFIPLACGYYLPGLFLKYRIASRRRRVSRELPDTLDMLLICLEAGLSFDMALLRVSKDLSGIAPVLSQEFGQYFLEIQSGLPRRDVLANLSARNGVRSLTSVVNVLLQSAKFGTDVAEALKVYSASMRTERRQRAEEQAAKISPKLTFPMVMLILPALLIVILGPALINVLIQFKDGF
jgi:tight adherence protein C